MEKIRKRIEEDSGGEVRRERREEENGGKSEVEEKERREVEENVKDREDKKTDASPTSFAPSVPDMYRTCFLLPLILYVGPTSSSFSHFLLRIKYLHEIKKKYPSVCHFSIFGRIR